MLVKPPLEKLLPKVDNRYTLAILVAKRARQLVDGAQPLMETDSPNFVTIACEELASNRISCVRGILNPYIPLRPEVEAARLAAKTAAAHASMADAVKDALDHAAGLGGDDLDESDAGLIAESLMKNPESLDAEESAPDAGAGQDDLINTENAGREDEA
ncbi:MAG: DNA-directed RNA polymerase subunit omega [Clostridiaceae bacterium]|nr:DNA-directed RNA polymerase subunit omega [Clostridiaceae bacterium]